MRTLFRRLLLALLPIVIALVIVPHAIMAAANDTGTMTRTLLPTVGNSTNEFQQAAALQSSVLAVVTTATPAEVAQGSSVSIKLWIGNGGNRRLTGNVLLSAVDPNAKQVYFRMWQKQIIRPGGALSLNASFSTSPEALAGMYAVRVTFQTADRSETYYENSSAATFRVATHPTATPTATVAPTRTPAPTATTPPTATVQPSSTPVPTAMPAPPETSITEPARTRLYGVLQGQPQYAASDWNAGMRLRTLEIGWNHYEPTQGTWNTNYIAEQRLKHQQMVDAGFMVVLDLGIQYPPSWAKNIRPWKDQYGNTFDAQVNAVWSPLVRQRVALYIQHVFQNLGTNFYGVRLGSGGYVETLYPRTPSGFQFSYWAFDADAATSNPVPGWRPGDPSPNGEALTFYNWYLQSLIDTVNWQQEVVRQHFGGYLIQLMPGQGLRPGQWSGLISSNLMPYGKNIFSAERGAVWDRILDGMRNRSNVIIDCSSVGDASATSPYVDEASTDPMKWSSAHWVAYNADRYGLPKMAENPGRNSIEALGVVFDQMAMFGYTSLLWAFEPDLYGGQYVTIDQYADMIARHP